MDLMIKVYNQYFRNVDSQRWKYVGYQYWYNVGNWYSTNAVHRYHFDCPPTVRSSDPRTWELAAPTVGASSSLCLPHSSNLWQSSEEEAMSWWCLWWGPPAPTFWDHWSEVGIQRWIDVGPIVNFCLGRNLKDSAFF